MSTAAIPTAPEIAQQSTATVLTIASTPQLDEVTCIFQDFGQNRGRILVECYGTAWSAYFGSMGTDSTLEFVRGTGVNYIHNKLAPQRPVPKRDEAYRLRVVQRIKEVLR